MDLRDDERLNTLRYRDARVRVINRSPEISTDACGESLGNLL